MDSTKPTKLKKLTIANFSSYDSISSLPCPKILISVARKLHAECKEKSVKMPLKWQP